MMMAEKRYFVKWIMDDAIYKGLKDCQVRAMNVVVRRVRARVGCRLKAPDTSLYWMRTEFAEAMMEARDD